MDSISLVPTTELHMSDLGAFALKLFCVNGRRCAYRN
jgi:hypothetical protein